jgi:hypothetical protein
LLKLRFGTANRAVPPFLPRNFQPHKPPLRDKRQEEQILAISIYCESIGIGEKSFGKRAKAYPGKAPLREILQAEVAGEHIEKKPVDNIDWDTKTLVEGELEFGGKTGKDSQLLVTSELPSLSFWPWRANKWKSLAPTISEMSYEALREAI